MNAISAYLDSTLFVVGVVVAMTIIVIVISRLPRWFRALRLNRLFRTVIYGPDPNKELSELLEELGVTSTYPYWFTPIMRLSAENFGRVVRFLYHFGGRTDESTRQRLVESVMMYCGWSRRTRRILRHAAFGSEVVLNDLEKKAQVVLDEWEEAGRVCRVARLKKPFVLGSSKTETI